MSSLSKQNTEQINVNKMKQEMDLDKLKPTETEENFRTKRISYQAKITETGQNQEQPIKNLILKERNGQDESKLNENEKNYINYEFNQNLTQAEFTNIFNKMKEILKDEFQNNCEEFYLISNNWFKRLNDIIKKDTIKNKNIKELIGKINNNDILIEKDIFNNAYFLDDEKNKMKILKPKYGFCNKIKPYCLNKKLWKFLYQYFGGGPEIKIYSEKILGESGKIYYKRDIFKYVRINCIILPIKRKFVDLNKNELIKQIQYFYFFVNKNININDLLFHLNQIIHTHQNIKLSDINNYKCWTDLNYTCFEDLFQNIKDKICLIYNMNDINSNSPLNLDKQEKDDSTINNRFLIQDSKNNNKEFGFKLIPINILKNESLKNIFPNQFTDYFDKINLSCLKERNQTFKDYNLEENEINDTPIFNHFPEFNILIEQGNNTLFYKNPEVKYKIGNICGYNYCRNKGIKGIHINFCECGKKFYCSYKCQNDDKRFHEDECQYLFSDYFLELISKKNYEITENSLLGKKGIRNIGNTCYMNTAIQCLSNCSELRNYFLFGNPHKDINKDNVLGYKGLVAYSFEYILKELWLEKEKVLELDKFKKAMGMCYERFKGMNQQDTHEFVTILIDSLHEDLNRVKQKIYIKKEERDLADEVKSKIEWNNYLRRNQSILVDLFYGQFKSTVTCSECKKSCIDFNIFSSIAINLKNHNKKVNSEDISNNINKLILNSKENNENKENNKNNIDDNKENKKITQKSNDTDNSENILFKNKEDINGALLKKEEVLVGGKPNESVTGNVNNNNIISNKKKLDNDLDLKIPIVFIFYQTEETPISFTLPLKNEKELTYKVLLLKISKIFKKDPYSLYMYHIKNGEKNIMNVYDLNNYPLYDYNNKKLLLVSEINTKVTRDNLIKESNTIFYESRANNFNKTKYISRQVIQNDLLKNQKEILKYINEPIDEKTILNSNIEDKYLKNHYMNLDNVYQFTLKNYIYEGNSMINHFFPKIIVYPRDKTILELYYEIIKMNKIILFENESNNNDNNKPLNNKNLQQIIYYNFNILFRVEKENVNINQIFSGILPFCLCLQKYNIKYSIYESEIFLLLNEKDKNKKLRDILINIKDQSDFPDNQILLKIYWNQKYNNKLKYHIRTEKIDKFFYSLISLNENENNKILNNSINNNNKKLTNEEVRIAQMNRYNKLFDNYKQKNNNLNTYDIYNYDKNIKSEDNNYNNNINNNNVNDNINNNINNNYINNINNNSNYEKKESNKNNSDEISLEDSLEILREEEILDENNEWFCENCKKKQKAKKKLEIYNTPKILIMQIKRFSQKDKINKKVYFPINDLDLNNFISSKEKDKNLKYDLFAVANHFGSLYFGHYTAFCKNSITNKWYEFNDSYVSEINDESKIISNNAYVLFYKRKDLSKLNWNEIYNKQFVNIDINNNNSMVDFNYDFIKNINLNSNQNINNENTMEENNTNNKVKSDNIKDNNMNEFDKKIKEEYIMKRKEMEKNQLNEMKEKKENITSENEVKNNVDSKEEDKNSNLNNSNSLLGKKRSSSE